MKKTIYLLTGIMAVSMIGCNGQTTGKEKDNTEQNSTTISLEESDSGVPVHLTKAEFLKQVMDYEKNPNTWVYQGEKPCLIDFYADWCAPCRITSPILEGLAKQYAGKINVYKVDIEREKELAAVFGIQSIPTFLFCPVEGNPTISSGIANTPAATRELFIRQIEELLLKSAPGSPTI
jgi:thioredoxin